MNKKQREHYKRLEKNHYKLIDTMLRTYFINKEILKDELIYNSDELTAVNNVIKEELKEIGFRVVKHGFGFRGICIMDQKEFDKKYPKAFDTNESGKYINLGNIRYIIYSSNEPYLTAIDNLTHDAWTEDFESLQHALKYLED